MKTSQSGLNLIKQFEGLRLKPYRCSAGVPTIGIGSTYYANGMKVAMTDKPITEAEALELFRLTIIPYENTINKLIKTTLNQNQFDALVSLCYNIGSGNIAKSSVIKSINLIQDKTTIDINWMKWNKAAGKVCTGLVNRRERELINYWKTL